MKFTFIRLQLAGEQARRERWSASALCRTVGVARSSYAAWCRRQSQASTPHQQEKQQAEARLRLAIRAAHRTERGYYGSPRIYDERREQGICVSRKRIARLMQQDGLVELAPKCGELKKDDSLDLLHNSV